MRREAGLTLLEVLIAVTLLSLLTLGMFLAMRLGLFAFSHTHDRLMENRRVAGAQRVLEQELEGLMPVVGPCGSDSGTPGPRVTLFQGMQNSLTMVSTFSLQEAWRGRPQILQFFIISADEGGGVRLVVNEIPYTGPLGAGAFCLAVTPDPVTGVPVAHFPPPAAGPSTFVLADRLAYCRFQYLTPSSTPGKPGEWRSNWDQAGWPSGIRIDMAPLDPAPARLQPTSVTVPIYVLRNPGVQYVDR